MGWLSFCVYSAILALLYPLYLYLQKVRRVYKFSSKIPGPIGIPILGSALKFLGPAEDYANKLSQLSKKYQSPCGFWLGPAYVVILSKCEDIDIVLKHPACYQKSRLYFAFEFFAKKGLFLLNNDEPQYRKLKKLTMRNLNPVNFNAFIKVIEEHTTNFCKTLICKKEHDIRTDVQALLVKIIAETLLGFKMSYEESKIFGEIVEDALNISIGRAPNVVTMVDQIFFMTKQGKKFRELYKKSFNLLKSKSDEMHQRLQNAEYYEFKTIYQTLLEDTEEYNLFNHDLYGHCVTLLVGGADTNHLSVCFTLMTLGMYPDIQQKVYEEISSVMSLDQGITFKDLTKLTYLERVFKETLRILAVGPITGKFASEDITLDSCTIPKGSEIILDLATLHKDPRYWKDPSKFDPDRFLPENYAKLPNSAYIPWSGGTRVCPGISYSYVLNKAILAVILRKFIVSCPFKSISDIELAGALVNKPKHGSIVSFKRREV